jgi:hypothetical protein
LANYLPLCRPTRAYSDISTLIIFLNGTLSDTNANRTSAVFTTIYYVLLDKYAKDLSDRSSLHLSVKHFKLVDSSNSNLFCDILKGDGNNAINGKMQGSIKMHTMINAMVDAHCLVSFSNTARYDHIFIKELDLQKGSLVVFDKAYTAYKHHFEWKQQDIYFVTCQKDNVSYKNLCEFEPQANTSNNILKDDIITVEKNLQTIELRRSAYWNEGNKKLYLLICDNVLLCPKK